MFHFVKKYSGNFGTEYGIEHTRIESYFNSNSTGDVFHIPRVPLNKSLNL